MKDSVKNVIAVPKGVFEGIKLIFQFGGFVNSDNRPIETGSAETPDLNLGRRGGADTRHRSVWQTGRKVLFNCRISGVILTLLASPAVSGPASFAKSSASFPYMVQDAPLQKVIREFSQFTGIPSKTYEVLNHKVTVDNTGGTVADFLWQLSETAEVSWWYDGKSVHFERPEMVSSESLELSGMDIEQLQGEIDRLGFDISAFPLQESENGKWVYLRGPPEFVSVVTDLVETVIDSKRVSLAALPKIIVGSHVKP